MKRLNLLYQNALLAFACLLFVPLVNAATAAGGLPDFTTLFEEQSPTVVNISTLATPKAPSARIYGPHGQELPEIFRRYFNIPMPEERSRKPQLTSLGSGFIISSDGYIVTNNHVIDGADKIIVRLSDRSEKEAKLIGADKRSDIALLKISTDRKLPTVTMDTAHDVKPGQWIAAIGSPFNFEYSITKGIVSQVNRSLPDDSYVPFIQADVPINPGNSGGPLFNLKGEVVGMNSQIFTRSGGFMGLSFAIPAYHIEWAVDQLKEKGYVTRGWLGVTVQEVNRDLAESFGLKKTMGALIAQVVPGGPSDKAKLQPGDIITKINGKEIIHSGNLSVQVGVIAPGKMAEIEFVRDGKVRTQEVKVGQLPDDQGQGQTLQSEAASINRLGVQVEVLTDDVKNKLDLPKALKGVVVTGVGNGVGQSIGLRQGDVLTNIGSQRIESVKEFNKIVKDLPKNRSISLRVVRGKQSGYISFRLDD